jgi:hypothetical protein
MWVHHSYVFCMFQKHHPCLIQGVAFLLSLHVL